MKHFHQFIQEMRIQRDVSLREFCREAELDPSNWSKVERGIADPPKSKEVLNRIARILKLNTEETNELMDLAMIDSIPPDLRPSDEVLAKLPIFFRTVRGEKPTETELRALIEKLRNS
jgi:transcriptional regulator with XRE-family HTH domain